MKNAKVASLASRLRAFLADSSGVSAVEFAFVAPVMAATLLGIAEYGSVMYDRTDMQSSVRSGAQYVMNGGRDTDTVESIVLQSWTSKPEDGEVQVTKYCLCAEVDHACSTPCPDQSVPESYIRIEATATLGGLVYDYGHNADETVRVR